MSQTPKLAQVTPKKSFSRPNSPISSTLLPLPAIMATSGPTTVVRQRYTNWTAGHDMAAALRYAKVPKLLAALVSVQHIDFHVHSAREDARQVLLAALADAPYGECVRYPEAAWAEMGNSMVGALFERCTSALAFGGSGAATNPQVGGHDVYSDSKLSFQKSRTELVRKLTSASANNAAADGVYMNRAIFERSMGLTWA